MKFLKRCFQLTLAAVLAFSIQSCSKDNDPIDPTGEGNGSEEIEKPKPVEPKVTFSLNNEEATATVSGKLKVNQEVTYQLEDERAVIKGSTKTDEEGKYQFVVEQIAGFDQKLVLTVKDIEVEEPIEEEKVDEPTTTRATDEETEVVEPEAEKLFITIPGKKNVDLSQEEISAILMSHQWVNDNKNSKTIVNSSTSFPPYSTFMTSATKKFDFFDEGKLTFYVSYFIMSNTDKEGKWAFNENGYIDIDTKVPVGDLAIRNIRFNKLTDEECQMVVEVTDGLYIMGLKK